MNSILSKDDSIVIKVGSNVLYDDETWVNQESVQNIVDGVDYLMNLWVRVFLVSSWAIAVGKKLLEKKWRIFQEKLSTKEQTLCASVWQLELMKIYSHLFQQKDIITSQALLTHNDFINPPDDELLKFYEEEKWIIPIINENDIISNEELEEGTEFSDNDGLAWLVSIKVWAKVLMILSNVNGFYKHYGKEYASIIDEVDMSNIEQFRQYVSTCKSTNWTWWLISKIRVFETMMKENIYGILANGKQKDVIQNIMEGLKQEKTVFRKQK
jgi:glutamate 5-kinase